MTGAGNTTQEYILTFLQSLDTEGKVVIFDVIIEQRGKHHFHGYVYENKKYGAGTIENFIGALAFWKRDNSVDTFYNVTKTAM